jgi:hypothetical protein
MVVLIDGGNNPQPSTRKDATMPTENDKKMVLIVATILTTVHDVGDWSPLSPITMALEAHGVTLESALSLMQGLQKVGLLRVTSETVTLTAKGIEAAKQIDAAVTK